MKVLKGKEDTNPMEPIEFVISMTTISTRQRHCIKTLKCLLEQTRLPDAIHLYVSEDPYLLDKGISKESLDSSLHELIQSTPLLTVHWVPNEGPYRKLLPFLRSQKWSDHTLVLTCDDDTLYKQTLVEEAISLWKSKKCCIGFRGTRIDSSFQYNSFPDAKGTESLWNLAKGNGCVLYQPTWFPLTPLFLEGWKDFPTTDDLWFTSWRIAAGIPCYISESGSFISSQLTRENLWLNYNENKNGQVLFTILMKLSSASVLRVWPPPLTEKNEANHP